MDTPFLPQSALLTGIAAGSMTEQLRNVHEEIAAWYPVVDRMAIALYDPTTGKLKTFVFSNAERDALEHHEVSLAEVPSLAALAASKEIRVIGDINQTLTGMSRHTQWLKQHGYRSSLTVPVSDNGELSAFFFFNSKQPHAFGRKIIHFLKVIAGLLCRLYLQHMKLVRGMSGMVSVVSGLACVRDLETGQHLERMAQYARLIASRVAEQHGFSDEFIEYLHLFAPLHDIGKVGVPDNILCKPGKLNEEEWIVMRSHVQIGEQLIDQIGRDLAHGDRMAFTVMRNIIACHHERGDGSGYPRGLLMDEIPMEGHIAAIADVYDALSNRRAYKSAWTEEQIVAELRSEVSKGRLHGECVEALIAAKAERIAIQDRFADEEVMDEPDLVAQPQPMMYGQLKRIS